MFFLVFGILMSLMGTVSVLFSWFVFMLGMLYFCIMTFVYYHIWDGCLFFIMFVKGLVVLFSFFLSGVSMKYHYTKLNLFCILCSFFVWSSYYIVGYDSSSGCLMMEGVSVLYFLLIMLVMMLFMLKVALSSTSFGFRYKM